jgi:hypothetical protein
MILNDDFEITRHFEIITMMSNKLGQEKGTRKSQIKSIHSFRSEFSILEQLWVQLRQCSPHQI